MKYSQIKHLKRQLDDLNIQDWREVIERAQEGFEVYDFKSGRSIATFYHIDHVKHHVVERKLNELKMDKVHQNYPYTGLVGKLITLAQQDTTFVDKFTLSECLEYLGSDCTEITIFGDTYFVFV